MLSYRVTDRDRERLMDDLERARQANDAKQPGISPIDRWLHRPLRQLR